MEIKFGLISSDSRGQLGEDACTSRRLWDFQRIPSRRDVEPKPARLFRGYKRHVVHPEETQTLDETARLYSQILRRARARLLCYR
jgi:hypothetical protein